MAEILCTWTEDLGLGLTAKYTIEDIGPGEPPSSGADWPREADLPQVRLTLGLPGRTDSYFTTVPKYLVDPALMSSAVVLSAPLDSSGGWGSRPSGGLLVERDLTIVRERRSAAVAELRVLAAEATETLQGVVGARAARLAAREYTLAQARAEERP